MTPKEKADELIDKFFKDDLLIWDLCYLQAKKCALIAVNEILNTLYDYHYDFESGAYEFWQLVKQEIEKS